MKTKLRLHSGRSRRGAALVMIALLMVSLAGLSIAMVTMTNFAHSSNRVSKQEIAAEAIADAGINVAYRALAAGGSGNLGSKQQPIAYDGASYWVTQTNGANSTVTLTSSATTRNASSSVTLSLKLASTPKFQWAAFGKDALVMNSNAFADSYNSNGGSYAFQATNGSGTNQHAASNGDVGSNGSILMKQNSKVFGDATPGPSGTTTVMGNAQLSGASTPATKPFALDPITLPNIASTGPMTIAKNGTTTIGPGSFHYTAMLANTGSTLNVTGPATIVCDSLTLRSNSKFLIDAAGGDVQIYVVDDFLLNSNAVIRPTDYKSKHLQINLLSDNIIDPDIDVNFDADELAFDSNSQIFGTIYAPNAKVTINSNFELFGSLVARDVQLDSNSRMHFDEALLTEGPMGTPAYQRVGWKVSN